MAEDKEDKSSEEERVLVTDTRSRVTDIVSYSFGTVLGRWDIRYATNQRSHLELLNPFSPLPIWSIGMLIDQVCLPSRETPPGYPLSIDWDGILVDEPDHQDDTSVAFEMYLKSSGKIDPSPSRRKSARFLVAKNSEIISANLAMVVSGLIM
jgi:hypothetical protein